MYFERLAQIESGNDPLAKNPNSSAKGRYQFIDSTAKAYGITAEFGTPEYEQQETDAVKRLTQDNYKGLERKLGREPTQGELYLAHQQGLTGALRLLKDPNKRAVDVLGNDEIKLNGGNQNMTTGEFSQLWTSKFDNGQETLQGSQGSDNLNAGRSIELPDGRQIQLNGEETPEQLQQIKDKIRQKYNIGGEEQPKTPIEQENTPEIAQTEPEKAGLGKTLFDQSLQGATFGFADEITDRLGAGIASIATGDNFGDLLSQARQSSGAELDKQIQDRPVASIASNLAGGLVTGGATAATKAGGRLANSIRSGSLGARVAKGATAGAASGATFGAGTSKDGERVRGATVGGATGAVVGGAIPSIGAGVSRALSKPSPIPNADQIRKLAGNAYKEAEAKGGILRPEFTNKFLDELEGFKPQTEAGKLLGGDSESAKVLDKLKDLNGKELSLEAAQEVDEFLSDKIADNMELGQLKKQGKKLLDVQNAFRDMIDTATSEDLLAGKEGFDALKKGRKLWSQSIKLRDIERIIERAELTDNPATAIKTGFRTLATNPKRMKSFSKEEQKLIREAAKTGLTTGVLRVFGSRLNTIIAGASGAGGLGGTAAVGAVGLAARDGATAIQVGKARKVAKAVAGAKTKPNNRLLEATPQTTLSGVSGGLTAQ